MWIGINLVQILAVTSLMVASLAFRLSLRENRQRVNAPAFDFYRSLVITNLWWLATSVGMLVDPSLGSEFVMTTTQSYSIARGTALLFLGWQIGTASFLIFRLREYRGAHEWQHARREDGA